MSSKAELDELDLSHNPHPVCPYCGAVDYDAWEWNLDKDDHECGKCGETFTAEGERITFWTTKKKLPQPEGNADGH